MSNLRIIYLNDTYGQSSNLSPISSEVISFLHGRGHQVLNLDQYSLGSKSAIYEQTLKLLKASQLVVVVLDKFSVLALVLLTQAFSKSLPVVVLTSNQLLYQELKAITHKQFHCYHYNRPEQVINTLKLFKL